MTRRGGAGALVLACVGACAVAAIALDLRFHGPYVSWHNRRCLRVAERAALVGASEDRVRAVLGEPSSVNEGWNRTDLDGNPRPDARRVTTYDYAPYPFLPYAKFQVHCVDGRVSTLEMFDW